MRWALLFALACTGCTLIDLSGDIHQAACRRDADCEILNDRNDLDFDPCRIWQCDVDSQRCIFAPTDSDHDGVQPPICVRVGQPADCRDDDPDINPNATEICDGVDNDCDQSVDEGMLDVAHQTALRFDADVLELGYAWNAQNEELGVVSRTASDGDVGFNVIGRNYSRDAEPLSFASDGTRVQARSVSAAASVGHFLAGVAETQEAQRLWVGAISGEVGASRLALTPAMRENGLHCAADEDCSFGPPIPASAQLGLSPLLGQVLVAYTRQPDPDACEAQEPQPILLNMLAEARDGVSEISPAAARLDFSADPRAPALAAIEHASEPFGWLAAYPNIAGDLIVQRVDLELATQRRLRIPRGAQPLTHVQLAVGSYEEDRVTLGVAGQLGCGREARVIFGVLQLSWDATGRSDLRVYRELSQIANEPAEWPVLAYNAAYADWGIAYVNDDGLFARVLDRNGLSVGGAAYAIRSGRPSVRDVAVVPGGDQGTFGVYSYDESRELDAAWLRSCTP